MSSAISGIFNKIPKKKNSHVYGWSKVWSENLGVELHQDPIVVDTLYLDHGANFSGGLNLFGGFTQDLKDRIDIMLECTRIVSLDREMPDYGNMLKSRKDVQDKNWCDQITTKLSEAKALVSSDLEYDWLAIGDSHTAAYSRNNSCVVKQDGTTLFGQNNSDFEYIRSHLKKRDFKGLTISLGNIDVRHHICRLESDWKSMYDELFRFGDSLSIDVEYSVPLPIEYEQRKLPKSGYYKGKPFWGSREERLDLVYSIIEYMKSLDINYVQPPNEWYIMDCEEYAKTYMEFGGSVHLSPEYYRRYNWGLPSNTLF